MDKESALLTFNTKKKLNKKNYDIKNDNKYIEWRDNMATPHIESKKEEISKIILMPGDPNRAKYIAENYLTNVKVINQVRGMIAYTGEYQKKKITIFPSGMGIPSIGIYSYELFHDYEADCIIRIGTIGAYHPDLKLGDIILATRAYSDSSFALVQSEYPKNYLDANSDLNQLIATTAKEENIKYQEGKIFTSDVFYEKKGMNQERLEQFDVLGVEMETFGLLQTARICQKKATAILTVSNSFCFDQELTSDEREKNLNNMIELALKSSLKL